MTLRFTLLLLSLSCLAPADDRTIYRILDNGKVFRYSHLGRESGAADWCRTAEQAAPWNGKLLVFAASGGHLYSVDGTGFLEWQYRKGPNSVAPAQGLAAGWENYRLAFAGADGALYAIDRGGRLLWFRHEDRLAGGTRLSGPKVIGTGWTFPIVFGGSAGAIYAVGADGSLNWYQHKGWRDGSKGWDRKKVGTGWSDYVQVFGAEDGVIYGIKANGDLEWRRHLGYADGTDRWEGPKKAGSGWRGNPVVFSSGTGSFNSSSSSGNSTVSEFQFLNEDQRSEDTTSHGDQPAAWLLTAAEDWMARLPDSKQLNQLSIPGTHDSGAQCCGAAQTQTWTIREQLDAGIRFLDVRVRRTGNAWAIHHGAVYLNMMFGDVMAQATSFLKEHPNEVVVVRLKNDHGAAPGSKSHKDIWDGYLNQFGDYVYDGDSQPARLGDVRGKIYVLSQIGGVAEWNGAKWGTHEVQDLYKVFMLAHDQVKADEAWATLVAKQRVIEESIEKARKAKPCSPLHINFLSGSTGMTPANVADYTNDTAYEYIAHTGLPEKNGILVMDYPGEQLVYRTIKANFPAKAQPGNQIWVGTAPFCSADKQDCTDLGMVYVKSDKKGDGAACATGTKVLCRPRTANDAKKAPTYSWYGTAPFCSGEKSDCTSRGLVFVKFDKKGNGETCATGRKVQCRTR